MTRAVTGLALVGMVAWGSVGPVCANPAGSAAEELALIPAAFSAQTQTLPARIPGVTADDRNKVICKDRVATGSRLAYARDCHTRAQWQMITQAARDYINGQQLRALNAAPPND